MSVRMDLQDVMRVNGMSLEAVLIYQLLSAVTISRLIDSDVISQK